MDEMDVDPDPNEHDIQKEFEMLLKHVVWPRHLPQSKSSNFRNEQIELLSHMAENVDSLSSHLPKKVVILFKRLTEVHKTPTPKVISNQINALRSGEIFAFFVRRQNCAFIVYRPHASVNHSDNVIVATFPGKLEAKQIHKVAGDIEVKRV